LEVKYTAVGIARINKISASPVGIKNKFIIKVPKGLKDAIEALKKNGNQLWEEVIKTECSNLKLRGISKTSFRRSLFQKFIKKLIVWVLISNNDFNRKINDKKGIYSGIVRIEAVLAFWENCMEFYVVYMTSEMPSNT
jgi:hypothetical protein